MRPNSTVAKRTLFAFVALLAAFLGWRFATWPGLDAEVDLDAPGRSAKLVAEHLPLLETAAEPASARIAVATIADESPRALEGWFADHALALEARCVDVDGRPLAGVEVTASQGGFESSALSDADGRVRIERNLAWFDLSLTLESIVSGRKRRHVELFDDGQMQVGVVARLAGHAPAEAWPEIILGETVQAGTLVLIPAGTIEGRVLDAEENPVSAATVRVTASEPRNEPPLGAHLWSRAPSVRTDELGRFRIEGVALGMNTVEATDAARRAARSHGVEVGAGAAATVELRLDGVSESLGIVVRVLSSAGEPVSGAVVIACEVRDGAPTPFHLQSATSADGSCRLTSSATYLAWVEAWDMSGQHGTARIEGVDASSSEIALRLDEPRWLELDVFRVDGAALASCFAVVRLLDAEGPGASLLSTSETLGLDLDLGKLFSSARSIPSAPGRARLPIPRRPFSVQVSSPGLRKVELGPFDPDSIASILRVELEPIPGLRGRVTRDGTAVAGAKVTLCTPLGGGRTWLRNGFPNRFVTSPPGVRTDREGRFALPVESVPTYVRAEARGCAPTEVGPYSSTDFDSAEIEIRLTRGGDLEGEVVVDAGRDPAGIVVGISRGDGFALTRRTDRSGRFRFEYLTPGDWLVHEHGSEISPRGASWSSEIYGPEHAWPTNAGVSEGRTTRFVLDLREPPRLILAGRGLADGRSLAGWRASLRALDFSMRTLERERAAAVVSADGRFELFVHEPGDYRLELSEAVTKSPGRKILDTISMPTNDVWSCDSPIGTVAGTAPRTGPRLHVRARTPSGAIVLCPIFPDESGAFRVENVPAGVAAIVEEPPTSFGREFETWPERLEVRVDRDAVTTVDLR